MKILLIAHSDSVHTARWVSQLADTGWDVRVFPCRDHGVVHPGLASILVYHRLDGGCEDLPGKLRWQKNRVFRRLRKFLGVKLPVLIQQQQRRVRQLLAVLDNFKPDIVHSIEFQVAGYLTAAARERLHGRFPPWIVTNWGNDIYWYRHFPEHEQSIRRVLAGCGYYSCECRRDESLAHEFGFGGLVLPIFPFAGGFDLEAVQSLRQPGPIAQRRTILLKGYQHRMGRALVALSALEMCAGFLKGYEVVIYSASRDIKAALPSYCRRTGIRARLVPSGTSHEEMLRLCGTARIALGLSLSDGVPAAFLEAMVMGAFPIQSVTAAADEWIDNGVSGLLVPPEDATAVAAALERALTDDGLVERAAAINARIASERLDNHHLKELTIRCYQTVAQQEGILWT